MSCIISDSAKLSQYFAECRQTRTNICVEEHYSNSPNNLENIPRANADYLDSITTASTSTAASVVVEKNHKFEFLCGSFDKRSFVYGVKFGDHNWHYFDDNDSIRSEHSSLSGSIDSAIRRMGTDKVGTVTLYLNNLEARLYFDDGKFKFKNKELKTCNVGLCYLMQQSNYSIYEFQI